MALFQVDYEASLFFNCEESGGNIVTVKNCYQRIMWYKFAELNCGFFLPCHPDLDEDDLVYHLLPGETARHQVTLTLHHQTVNFPRTNEEKKVASHKGKLRINVWGFNPEKTFIDYPNFSKEISCVVIIPAHQAISVSVLVKWKKV